MQNSNLKQEKTLRGKKSYMKRNENIRLEPPTAPDHADNSKRKKNYTRKTCFLGGLMFPVSGQWWVDFCPIAWKAWRTEIKTKTD